MDRCPCKGITQTLIPDTLAVKPKASQSTDGNLLWSVVYISDTACLRVGAANDTQPAFSQPTPVKAALASHWRIYRRCPLTVPLHGAYLYTLGWFLPGEKGLVHCTCRSVMKDDRQKTDLWAPHVALGSR
jgi:hypothetical protein